MGLGAGLAGFGMLLAALLYVAVLWIGEAVLWIGEAVSARPHTVRRTALLTPDARRHRARTLLQTVLQTVLLVAPLGLLAILGIGLVDDPGLRETLPVPVNATLPAAVLAVVVAGAVALAVRSVGRRAADGRAGGSTAAAGRGAVAAAPACAAAPAGLPRHGAVRRGCRDRPRCRLSSGTGSASPWICCRPYPPMSRSGVRSAPTSTPSCCTPVTGCRP